MIDPIQSLAFSMQANRGVYALLLGSGVSKSAEIPTGWEIVVDLLRKLAAAEGESADPDPGEWYQRKYDEAPDYSKLLDHLAKTAAERQRLLRPYFEPNDQDREEGLKLPTGAHRAIAHLVAQGFVRVIITTNFDRLIERALEDAGVTPTVLSSPDHVKGAFPLIHTQCCVFKVHGDYQDTRIRNSPTELEGYPQEFNQLLDRILDEFGLIVCGWSADWDVGLREAIFRAPSRRFTTYWALRGDVSNEARRLIDHRQAQVVSIEDADLFFEALQQTVESIEEFSRPHPLSTEAAVASLKRYLSSPEQKIRLVDLIDATVEQVVSATSGDDFEAEETRHPTAEELKTLVPQRLRTHESACSTLLSMASVGGFWAEDVHYQGWGRAIERLATNPAIGRYSPRYDFRTYPGLLLMYSLGLGAVASDTPARLRFLSRIFKTTVNPGFGENRRAFALTTLVNEHVSLNNGGLLQGMENKSFPLSYWLHDVLRQHFKQLIPNDQKYSFVFDKLEVLVAMGFVHLENNGGFWAPPGAFVIRRSNRRRILAEIRESIVADKDASQFVASGIFGRTSKECLHSLEEFEEISRRAARSVGIYL